MSVSSDVAMRWRVRLGYPLALACFLLAQPTLAALAAGGAIGLIGLALRAAAAGHLRKFEELATSGPYAWTRNPLYFGSALLAAGFVVAGRSWPAALLTFVYFAALYPAVMRREEEELRVRYGTEFADYAARVPLFWPRWPRGTRPGVRFSPELYRRNREHQAAIGFLAVIILLVLKMRFAR